MKKIKAFLSAMLIISAVMMTTACNSSSSSSTNVKKFDKEKTAQLVKLANDSGLLDGELENKKIKWLCDWDINADPHADLALFQELYDGEVEYIQCTYENRYEKLARYISSGEGIDFFYAGNGDSFPKCVSNKLFSSYDDYIDLDSALWKDVKSANDMLKWNDKHYIAITQIKGDDVAVIYNKKTVQEAGLKDPAVLYKNGEWTWDSFQQMLENFVDTKNNKFGIDGWWFEFGLISTIGVPSVGYENGKLKSNIGSPAMERVQNRLYELYSKDCIAIGVGEYGWEAKPQYIGEGKLLFYPVGLYELYMEKDKWQKLYGEDAGFVPMPRDPEADAHYISTGIEAYALVSGGQNPEGVAKYLNCKRFCMVNEEANKIGKSIFRDDYGWTDEMFEMREEMQRLAAEHPVFDLSTGVSGDCGALLDSSLRQAARGTAWNETYDSIAPVVKGYIDEVNEELAQSSPSA